MIDKNKILNEAKSFFKNKKIKLVGIYNLQNNIFYDTNGEFFLLNEIDSIKKDNIRIKLNDEWWACYYFG